VAQNLLGPVCPVPLTVRGKHDDEASELGHRRARLATLRKERAALADASGDCTDDAFLRRHFDFFGGRVMRVVKGGLAGNVIEPV